MLPPPVTLERAVRGSRPILLSRDRRIHALSHGPSVRVVTPAACGSLRRSARRSDAWPTLDP